MNGKNSEKKSEKNEVSYQDTLQKKKKGFVSGLRPTLFWSADPIFFSFLEKKGEQFTVCSVQKKEKSRWRKLNNSILTQIIAEIGCEQLLWETSEAERRRVGVFDDTRSRGDI